MKIIGNKLIAEEGKILKRVVGTPFTGSIIILGKTKVNGELVDDSELYYEEVDKAEVAEATKHIKDDKEKTR